MTSPAFRAVETVRHARLDGYEVVEELGDNGRSMQGVTEAQAEWLRRRAARVPATGTNVVIVTHSPNLEKGFPEWGGGVAEGETVILQPDGRGRATVAGRIKIGQWASLRAD